MNDLTTPPPLPAIPTGPLPFTRLLDEAIRQARRNFRAIYPAVALPLALISGATGLLQALWFQRVTGEIGDQSPPTFSFETIAMGLIGGIVMGIGMVALQKAAVDAVAGQRVDMKESWRFAVHPPVLGTLFLQGLAIGGSMVACLVPILYVAPLLSLVGPIMVAESLFGAKALSRSAELTRYNPRNRFSETALAKALGLMLVTLVISYTAAFLVVIPFQIPMFYDIFKQAASGEEPSMGVMAKWIWLQIPSQILQMLANVAVYLYSSFGFALLFFDARSRKEGSDLTAEINAVFGPGTTAREPAP